MAIKNKKVKTEERKTRFGLLHIPTGKLFPTITNCSFLQYFDEDDDSTNFANYLKSNKCKAFYKAATKESLQKKIILELLHFLTFEPVKIQAGISDLDKYQIGIEHVTNKTNKTMNYFSTIKINKYDNKYTIYLERTAVILDKKDQVQWYNSEDECVCYQFSSLSTFFELITKSSSAFLSPGVIGSRTWDHDHLSYNDSKLFKRLSIPLNEFEIVEI